MHDTLDPETIARRSPAATVEHHGSIGSTNDRARELAADVAVPLPALVLAEEQTAGRGRGANRWWTGAGSLAMSLLVDPARWQVDVRQTPLLSLALALSAMAVLRPRLPAEVSLGLHWPNDVFANERKICGILVEVPRPGRYVLGIGLNVNNSTALAPADVAARATSLVDLSGQLHPRTEVVIELVAEIDRQLAALGRAPRQLAQTADQACLQLGQQLTVDTGFRQVTGVCQGIACDGGLRLLTDSGEETLYAGALVHGR